MAAVKSLNSVCVRVGITTQHLMVHNKSEDCSARRHSSTCCDWKQASLLAMLHRGNLIVFHILPHFTGSWSFTRFIQRHCCCSRSVTNQISSRPDSVSTATPVFQQSRLKTWSKMITKQERKIKAVMRASWLTCCVCSSCRDDCITSRTRRW